MVGGDWSQLTTHPIVSRPAAAMLGAQLKQKKEEPEEVRKIICDKIWVLRKPS